MKNNFFYTAEEIKKMKELLKMEEPIARIAKRHHKQFNVSLGAFTVKLYSVAKTLPGRVNSPRSSNTKMTLNVPNGTSFEGVAKKVRLYSDHFRVYF